MSERRCNACGYSEEDARTNGDHRLCKNAGNAPWERRKPRPEPASPQESAPRMLGAASFDPKPEHICVHCGAQLGWQVSFNDQDTCSRGYWFSYTTGAGCPKSDYGHERITNKVKEYDYAKARSSQPAAQEKK